MPRSHSEASEMSDVKRFNLHGREHGFSPRWFQGAVRPATANKTFCASYRILPSPIRFPVLRFAHGKQKPCSEDVDGNTNTSAQVQDRRYSGKSKRCRPRARPESRGLGHRRGRRAFSAGQASAIGSRLHVFAAPGRSSKVDENPSRLSAEVSWWCSGIPIIT